MRSTNRQLILIFLLSLFFNSALANGAVTNCTQDETPVFSCTMRNKKILSLCSTDNNKFLTYRYGKSGQIEFTYPSEKTASDKIFSYSHYFRYRTDYFILSFTNQDHRYAVFRYYSDDGSSNDEPVMAGVSVTNLVSEKEYTNRCKTIESDSISILRDYIPCDPNGDFGCKSNEDNKQ
jgi:hypothetical protein